MCGDTLSRKYWRSWVLASVRIRFGYTALSARFIKKYLDGYTPDCYIWDILVLQTPKRNPPNQRVFYWPSLSAAYALTCMPVLGKRPRIRIPRTAPRTPGRCAGLCG